MEIIYKKACGVDVHKSFIVAVICDSTEDKPKYTKKRFSTYNNSLKEFLEWLKENDCENVCMESTGKYYIPVYNALEGQISNVVVANPKWVAAIKGEKDDNKDAKWIANLFKLGLVKASYIPEKRIRELREFTRYRRKLIQARAAEKNRYTNALTIGNCKVDVALRDVFGVTAQKLIKLMLEKEEFSDEDIIRCIHKNCKSSNEEIIASVRGIELSEYQKFRIKEITEMIEIYTKRIERLERVIDEMVEPYESQIEVLCTIPGLNRYAAITIISEVGVDMGQFKDYNSLCAWAGLVPSSNESAGKKKSVKISKAGVNLKPCLIEVAQAAMRSKKNPYYANKGEQIGKRRGKKRAKIAVARKILIAVYHILSTGEVWNPKDLAKVETTEKEKIRFTKNNFTQTVKQLTTLGLTEEEIIEIVKKQTTVQE